MKVKSLVFSAVCAASMLLGGKAEALRPDWFHRDIFIDRISVDQGSLGRYFSADEIATYDQALRNSDNISAFEGEGEVNRLTDPGHNRCGDNQIPPGDCPRYQETAWASGGGCINGTEYNYARENAIAPLCSPLDAHVYIGWCRCGCFEQETEIFAFDRSEKADVQATVSSIRPESHELYALTERSELDALSFERRKVSATTVGAEEKPLVWLHLVDGTELGLTEEHAVLLSTGEMIAAKELNAKKHQLVSKAGDFVKIASIERIHTQDDVYNVLTDAGLNHKGHMIVANGYIVGDIMWQNTLASDLRKVVVRQ